MSEETGGETAKPPTEKWHARSKEEEKANGWTVESKADYMRRRHGVEQVYVG